MSLRQRFERAASEMESRVVNGYESSDGVCRLVVRGRVLMPAKSVDQAARDNGLHPEALQAYLEALGARSGA